MTARRYALFLHDGDPPAPRRVARWLQGLERPVHSFSPLVARRVFGILAEGMPREDADLVSNLLAERGLGTDVVEHAWLWLPRSTYARKAAVTTAGLVVYDMYGRTTESAWRQVAVVATGSYPSAELTRVQDLQSVVGGRGAGAGEVEYEPQDSEQLVLDVVLLDPPRRLRVVSHQFDYSYLGERRTPSAARNFLTLVLELCRYVPGAIRNRGADRLVKDGRRVLRYPDSIHFEREICCLLWRHFGPGRRLDAGGPYRGRGIPAAEPRPAYLPPGIRPPEQPSQPADSDDETEPGPQTSPEPG